MLLGTPLQTAYVTSDMDRACAMLGSRFGVSQFLRIARAEVTSDAGEEMVLALAHAWVGDVWLEIIQPLDGAVSIYRDFLPDEGFAMRFHHIGIRVHDLAARDRIMAEISDAGLRITFSITRGPPSEVFYVDTVAELGHYTEYLYFPDLAQSTMVRMPHNPTAS